MIQDWTRENIFTNIWWTSSCAKCSVTSHLSHIDIIKVKICVQSPIWLYRTFFRTIQIFCDVIPKIWVSNWSWVLTCGQGIIDTFACWGPWYWQNNVVKFAAVISFGKFKCWSPKVIGIIYLLYNVLACFFQKKWSRFSCTPY